MLPRVLDVANISERTLAFVTRTGAEFVKFFALQHLVKYTRIQTTVDEINAIENGISNDVCEKAETSWRGACAALKPNFKL